MGLLISQTDFTGRYKIAQGSFTDLDSYITQYESDYIKNLLGSDLYDLFAADVDSATKLPVTVIYLSLYNAFSDDNDGCLVISKGMKKMIIGFIYFHYMRDQKIKNTTSGNVVESSEISREAGFTEYNLYSRFNESKVTYDAIQWFITENEDDYPDYNGQEIAMAHWAL